jgi:hypothetical protein
MLTLTFLPGTGRKIENAPSKDDFAIPFFTSDEGDLETT